MGIFSALAEGVSSGITSGVGGGIGSMIAGAFQKDPKTEKFDAHKAKADMDIMYEGTSPWERLGATGSAAAVGAQSAQNVQDSQRKTQLELAKVKAGTERYGIDKQNETAKEVARIQNEPKDRMADVAEQKAPAEIANLDSRTKKFIKETIHESFKVVETLERTRGLSEEAKIKKSEAVMAKAKEQFADYYAIKGAASSSLFSLIDKGLMVLDKKIRSGVESFRNREQSLLDEMFPWLKDDELRDVPIKTLPSR